MRFMVLMYPGKDAEAGVLPDEKILAEMGKFNEELARAGVLLSGEGLQPTSKGWRVRFPEGKPQVSHGPFSDAKEVVGGFWLWKVRSREEAIEWAKRCPVRGDEMLELRQVFEAEDFGEAFTPELRQAEERLRNRAVPK